MPTEFTTIFRAVDPAGNNPEPNFVLIMYVPPEISSALDEIRQRYDPVIKMGIPPHITIKRLTPLGDEVNIARLQAAAAQACQQIAPFKVELDGYGVFRKHQRNTVYLKVRDESPFCRLHVSVIEALKQVYPDGVADGYEGENYHPHLTIGNFLSDIELAVLEHELTTGSYRMNFAFVANQVSLLIQNQAGEWVINQPFEFTAKPLD